MQAAYLEQLKENFKTVGLGVLGVNMNGPKIINQVRPWINKRKISYDISVDPGHKLGEEFKISGYPAFFLVDSDGLILDEFTGFMEGWESKYLEALKQYLDKENISYQDFQFDKKDRVKKNVIMGIDF